MLAILGHDSIYSTVEPSYPGILKHPLPALVIVPRLFLSLLL